MEIEMEELSSHAQGPMHPNGLLISQQCICVWSLHQGHFMPESTRCHLVKMKDIDIIRSSIISQLEWFTSHPQDSFLIGVLVNIAGPLERRTDAIGIRIEFVARGLCTHYESRTPRSSLLMNRIECAVGAEAV